MLTLPWAQLTSLTLQTAAYFPILRLTPNLVQCDLFVFTNMIDTQSPIASVTLPRLASLVLNVPKFDFVSIPALTAFIARAGCTELEDLLGQYRSGVE
ncbi:hypothetical protein B0H16DRAFT_1542621 [Mycena metata]|uniref:Uncharacterized protein n=1 Tax=Mycena metata TaxID=1033252 RepID=A0AAD7J0K2_9AGAR|nr:hypothetical protein B0H16DRAFT_1542621 [Mycena metata]